jgi:tetratricopeptide (TPR) repeat protein
MKQLIVAVAMLLSSRVFGQDINIQLKEASNLEKSLKETEALDKYKSIVATDPSNIQALEKSSELSAAVGARQADKKVKAEFYEQAKDYADKALAVNAGDAEANYARALAAQKLSEIETENKKIVADIKEVKTYTDKALAINPNHGKANYLLGKWNFQMVSLGWTKKAAIKVLFGGMPDATIENAFKYMEKCRIVEPYYVQNFLDLAKAYKYDNQPAKAIDVLNQLVKLPIRTADDATLKAEGKKLLSEMQ